MSDRVLVTKVSLPDVPINQLISNIKREPYDKDAGTHPPTNATALSHLLSSGRPIAEQQQPPDTGRCAPVPTLIPSSAAAGVAVSTWEALPPRSVLPGCGDSSSGSRRQQLHPSMLYANHHGGIGSVSSSNNSGPALANNNNPTLSKSMTAATAFVAAVAPASGGSATVTPPPLPLLNVTNAAVMPVSSSCGDGRVLAAPCFHQPQQQQLNQQHSFLTHPTFVHPILLQPGDMYQLLRGPGHPVSYIPGVGGLPMTNATPVPSIGPNAGGKGLLTTPLPATILPLAANAPTLQLRPPPPTALPFSSTSAMMTSPHVFNVVAHPQTFAGTVGHLPTAVSSAVVSAPIVTTAYAGIVSAVAPLTVSTAQQPPSNTVLRTNTTVTTIKSGVDEMDRGLQVPITLPPTTTTRSSTPTTAVSQADAILSLPVSVQSKIAAGDGDSHAAEEEEMLWNRVIRSPGGDVVFQDAGRLRFSRPEAMLRQIRSTALSDDSLSLQLPPGSVNPALVDEPQTNGVLPGGTSNEQTSRKGFHVCHCCQQWFTSKAAFDSHMLRPIARIFYRCHLCHDSEPHAAAVRQPTSSASPRLEPNPTQPASQLTTISCSTASEDAVRYVTSSTYYHQLLPCGVVVGPNRCAVFSHMVSCHFDQVRQTCSSRMEAWDLLALRPSMMTVCPLPEFAWTSDPADVLNGTQRLRDASSTAAVPNRGGKDSVEAAASGKLSLSAADASDKAACPTSSLVLSLTSSGNSAQSAFYYPGSELFPIWRDFQRSVSMLLPHLGSSVFSPSPASVSRRSRLASTSPRLPQTTSNSSSPTDRWKELPPSDSPLSQLVLHLTSGGLTSSTSSVYPTTEAALFAGQLFFTDWCQESTTEALVEELSGGNSTETISLVDDCEEEMQGGDVGEGDRLAISPPVMTESSTAAAAVKDIPDSLDYSTEPPAPSISELNESLASLYPSRSSTSTASTLLQGGGASGDVPASTVATAPPTPAPPKAVLRCLLCPFRTNRSEELRQHLRGPQQQRNTKCALCGHTVFMRQPELCSVKAHLLLHMQCYVMCPMCGFSPPAYLPPDMAEICLRLHLRFVCFHFNLIQAYCCTDCHVGPSMTHFNPLNMCLHRVESHFHRVYACLRCLRQAGALSVRPVAAVQLNDSGDEKPVEPLIPYGFTDFRELAQHIRGVHGTQLNHSSAAPADKTNHFLTVASAFLKVSSPVVSQDGPSGLQQTTTLTPVQGPNAEAVNSLSARASNSNSDPAVTEFGLVQNVNFVPAFRCCDCETVLETKAECLEHYRISHIQSYNQRTYLRCFGACKRIHFEVEPFRMHLTTCRFAKQFYRAIFSSQDDGVENFMCFCFHCGIRTQPRGVYSGSASWRNPPSGSDSPLTIAGSASSADGKENAPERGAGGGGTVQSSTGASMVKAAYFPDLASLHQHEELSHAFESSSAIACPWCSKRLSGRNGSSHTAEHLRSHLAKHRYASWAVARSLKWKENPADLPHCTCGSALLDSPLAMVSHAGAFLVSFPSTCLSGGNTAFVPVLGAGSPLEQRQREASLGVAVHPPGGTHIPCTSVVLRHLRFATHPQLDHYLSLLDEGTPDPFICPLCRLSLRTRWALSEHAFIEHWAVLCYICCLKQPDPVVEDTDRGQPAEKSLWKHMFECLTARQTALTTADSQPAPTTSSDIVQKADHGQVRNPQNFVIDDSFDSGDSVMIVDSDGDPDEMEASVVPSTIPPDRGEVVDRQRGEVEEQVLVEPPRPDTPSTPATIPAKGHVLESLSSKRPVVSDKRPSSSSYSTDTSRHPPSRRRRISLLPESDDEEANDSKSSSARHETSTSGGNKSSLQETTRDPLPASHPSSTHRRRRRGRRDRPAEPEYQSDADSRTSSRTGAPAGGGELTEERAFVCYLCHHRLSNKANYKRHIIFVHKLTADDLDWDLLMSANSNKKTTTTSTTATAVSTTKGRDSQEEQATSPGKIQQQQLRHSPRTPKKIVTARARRLSKPLTVSPNSQQRRSIRINNNTSVVDKPTDLVSAELSIDRSSSLSSQVAPCYCNVCKVDYRTEQTLSIHMICAHGNLPVG